MSSRTKVSKQVKVTQGNETTTFELVRRGMVIHHTTPVLKTPDGGSGYIEFTLGKPVLDALRELLGLQHPNLVPDYRGDSSKPIVTIDDIEKRFTREGGDTPKPPDRPPEETPVDGSGLTKATDKTESGMD